MSFLQGHESKNTHSTVNIALGDERERERNEFHGFVLILTQFKANRIRPTWAPLILPGKKTVMHREKRNVYFLHSVQVFEMNSSASSTDFSQRMFSSQHF